MYGTGLGMHFLTFWGANLLVTDVIVLVKSSYISFTFLPSDNLLPSSKMVSEYDQEIPQSQTADNPLAPWGRAAQPSRDTRKTN